LPDVVAYPVRSSIIVTTYNWPSALDLVLESALHQSAGPFEVLVADDGSAEPTADLVRSFVPRFEARGIVLRHVWHPDRGFRVAEIRNRALAAATGEYVLLVDGDCVLHPDFVRSHLAFARPGAFVQGTRVLLSRETTTQAIARRRTRFNPLGRGLRNRLNALSLPALSRVVPSPSDPLRGVRSCNMGMWRNDAIRVNGFDERFVGWGREDSEFVARLVRAGLRRRKLKFGGVMYHLWHAEQPRDALEANDRILAEALAEAGTRCAQGIDQYLGEPESALRGYFQS
jgi:glycosyltransferase involved in cell wall biosynthesis